MRDFWRVYKYFSNHNTGFNKYPLWSAKAGIWECTLKQTSVRPPARPIGRSLVGRAPVVHWHSTFLSPHSRSTIVAFSSSQGSGRGGSDVEETSRTPWSRMKGNIKKFRMSAIMGVEVINGLGWGGEGGGCLRVECSLDLRESGTQFDVDFLYIKFSTKV